MKVTILGCGGSGGVPLPGPHWGRCDPKNPRNSRRRVSVLVEEGATAILIDTSPDLRMQLLDAGACRLDAVLYTHDHADHTQGIDDVRFLRPSLHAPPINAYGTAETMGTLESRFPYVFSILNECSSDLYRPFLRANKITGPFSVNGIPVTPFEQDHGYGARTTGYRIGKIAYSTDVVALPEAAFDILAGVDLWIVDCLRYEAHPTHAHFDLALEWIDRVRPKHAILTHMNHTLDYAELKKRCPPNVEPAYDGLSIHIPG